jgi:hypothetical protein
MAHFEVQRYSGGDWLPYSDFDDKGFAIEAAKDLMAGRNAPGAVRVVEVFNDDKPPRTVFRHSPLDEHNVKARREQFELEREVEAARAARKADRARNRALAAQRPQRRRGGGFFIVLRVILAVALAYGAYVAWRHGWLR